MKNHSLQVLLATAALLLPCPATLALAGPRLAQPLRTAERQPQEGFDDQDGFEDFDDFEQGPQLVPGVLPAGTSEQARALWQALCSATLVPGVERAPVQSFDLTFDLRANVQGSHDVNQARFLFKAPGYVSSQLSPTNHLMRGPRGDWLVAKDQAVQIQGREMSEDRRQLDDTLSIAHNFVKLTDPRRMRIAALSTAEAPSGLPEDAELTALAAQLQWLEVESPDLRLFRDGSTQRAGWAGEPSYRGLIGLDPKTRLPQLVLINEASRKRDLSQAMLVAFRGYRPRNGYLVPHQIRTYRLDPQARVQRFSKRPELDMWLFSNRGSLNPEDLSDESFVPEALTRGR